MEEWHDESDNGSRFEHATKALGLLEQVGHNILMGELHALHETRSARAETNERELFGRSARRQFRRLKIRRAMLNNSFDLKGPIFGVL